MQHHLLHALTVSSISYEIYDECLSSLTCDAMPQFSTKSRSFYEKHCFIHNKNAGKSFKFKIGKRYEVVTCALNCRLDLNKCDLKEPIKKGVKIYTKTSSYPIQRNFCKRLSNMKFIAQSSSDFLTNAKFSNTKSICPPSEHMNLYKENAVDVHVDTNAKDLKFKVMNSGSDAFLSGKNMKYDADKKIVTVVYDCTKDGIARDRCQKSLNFPACTTEKSINTIEVSDGSGDLLSTCEVWVKGVNYGLKCEESNRSRRLLGDHRGGS